MRGRQIDVERDTAREKKSEQGGNKKAYYYVRYVFFDGKLRTLAPLPRINTSAMCVQQKPSEFYCVCIRNAYVGERIV